MPKVKHGHDTRNVVPFSRSNIDGMPDDVKGVYAYWCRANGKCIYVGKAEKQPIKQRLMQEWRAPHNEKLSLWMRAFGQYLDICYLHVKSSNINKAERRLIKQLNPETNKIHSKR